jgi:hypothetical protein
MGACSITCASGFANCDGLAVNGCEINLTNNPQNCGGCGHVCSFPNATAACSNSNCLLSGCNPGFGNCNGQPGDGCEANTLTDPQNCGGCNIVCAGSQVCANGACQSATGKVFMTSANGSGGFYEYDVATNTWATRPDPPTVTFSQLTTDGTVVFLLGKDNEIYEYDPSSQTWNNVLTGPGPEASDPIGFFKWTPSGFYYANDGTSTLMATSGFGFWTTIFLPIDVSCAGSFDPSSGWLFIREWKTFGLLLFDTSSDSVKEYWPNPTDVGENSRTGSFVAPFFYERDFAGPLFTIDVTSGTATNTGTAPSEQHTSSDADPATGDIYFGPYSPTGTAFQVFHTSSNKFTNLAPSPPVTNHSTIVFVRGK